MSYESAKRYKQSDATAPRAWVFLLGVFLSAVIMVVAAKIALNLYPKRSDFLPSEKVAAETYSQYSLRLEAIKKECLNELDTIGNEDLYLPKLQISPDVLLFINAGPFQSPVCPVPLKCTGLLSGKLANMESEGYPEAI